MTRIVRNIGSGCILGFVSALAMAVLVIAVPGLSSATGADSTQPVTIYVLMEGLRQLLVSCVMLMLLRAEGGLRSWIEGAGYAFAHGVGTSVLVLLFQLALFRQTGMSMLVEATALLIGSLAAVAVVRPNADVVRQ
ncbi:hypothetical protein [Actinomyces qiguomingii]|uniref:hypothetical protein n=1 Tax=Actinomyces qiguomingii TaxID=2057800 RepID=UPI000FFF336D|nr:hypothetical protein [Actinomyces qiguomingii]